MYYNDEYYQFSAIAPLRSYGTASSITDGKAVINGAAYKLSNNVAVYYKEDSLYCVQTSLESVTNENFKLTCYYDKTENEGGRIRVIIAEHK